MEVVRGCGWRSTHSKHYPEPRTASAFETDQTDRMARATTAKETPRAPAASRTRATSLAVAPRGKNVVNQKNAFSRNRV